MPHLFTVMTMMNGIKEHSGGSLKLFFIILVTIVVNFHKSRITVQ